MYEAGCSTHWRCRSLPSERWASGGRATSKGVDPQDVADMLHTVMSSDRTVYTRLVVNRLMNEEKVIKASEHFKDDKSLPLPAQMFRFGAEMVAEKIRASSATRCNRSGRSTSRTRPRPTLRRQGLDVVAENKGKPFYGEEELGGKKYFTAVYADKAVADACVSCHNEHKDTPEERLQARRRDGRGGDPPAARRIDDAATEEFCQPAGTQQVKQKTRR